MYKKPKGVDSHYMGQSRGRVLMTLLEQDPFFEYRIGYTHVGAKNFRHEYHDFEIIAEYRPVTRDRKNRYAIYARYLGPIIH